MNFGMSGQMWMAVPPIGNTVTELRIPSKTNQLGNTTLEFYDTVRSPSETEINAFRPYRAKYSELYLDEGYKVVQDNAFKYMQFEEIYLPITLETIGADAFNGNRCISLEVPSSVTDIGDRAFASETLQTLTLKCDLSALSSKSLSGCTRLTTLLICNYTGNPSDITPEQFGLQSDVKIIFA